MVVDAVMMLDDLLQLKMIGIKKVQGGALEVSVGAFLEGWETRDPSSGGGLALAELQPGLAVPVGNSQRGTELLV